ncbi:MAG: hypothetical protein B9S32_04200 [Verrucomicrobia bacterium Tous-C9LFEB]|nr:MAG: hypothetical protein B9S32_04200 [Verrucomicrobia bacterium Tous-C9LFEB]
MLNHLKRCVRIVSCIVMLSTTAYAASSSPLQVGYLVDYQFPSVDGNWQLTGQQGRVSDWEVDSRAGYVSAAYWDHLTLSDSSSVHGIEMRKPFQPQSSGVISAEFKFVLPVLAEGEGLVWALRADRDHSLIEFTISGGKLGYRNAAGNFVSLITCYSWVNYTVHAVVDLSAQTAVISVNGVNKASGSVFRQTQYKTARQFYMATSRPGTGSAWIYYVTISKGYKVLERFTNATAGSLPVNWTGVSTAGPVSAQTVYGSHIKDRMSAVLDDSSTTSSSTLGRNFASSTSKLVWQFKFLLPMKTDGMTATLRNGSTAAVTFTTANGALAYLNSSNAPVTIWPDYRANIWYTVRIIADPVTHRADIYINGKLKAAQAPVATTPTAFDNILFSTSAAGSAPLWIDDVLVYDFIAEPADYVPPIQSVASLGYMVGMQSFFAGWTEGRQAGWDWPYRYPNHDTYLGFYDGGNVEAMDWQLKWMAEAGINFVLDCWYPNRDGRPIKDPTAESVNGPIHDAYFYAKYSNRVKFALAAYALDDITEEDFVEYVLPYWIEYYFKDPRYFVIPGPTKGYPVISIGEPTTWISLPNNAMKNSITALRMALAAEGYDGVVVMGMYNLANLTTMNNLYNAGIDYCHAYWGGSVIATTQNRLISQRDANSNLKPIANAGQGASGEAWDIVHSPQAYTTLSDFLSMSLWMRNVFLPSTTPAGSVSGSMVLYDNWNEYGEGHYICPTNLAGFGYLDQIRAAFTATGSLTSAVPTETQKARFNTLYSRGWEGRSWTFDALYPDTEGWSINYQMATLTQSGGFLNGTISGSNSSLISRDGYAIDATQYKLIKVRMKNSTTGTSAKIYFTTTTDGVFSESKAVTFPLIANDPGYTEYNINMGSIASWSGKIRQLRFDPVETNATTGSFSLDYIKVVDANYGDNATTTLLRDTFSTDGGSTPAGWRYGTGSIASPLGSGDSFYIDTATSRMVLQDYAPYATSSSPISAHSIAAFNFKATNDKILQFDADVTIGAPLSRVNLALNKTVTVSSLEGAQYSANSLVDGLNSTRWSSTFSDPQWAVVDLGASYSIAEVSLNWEAACGRDYLIQTSVDGASWATQVTVTGNTATGVLIYPLVATARYVRLYVSARATPWGCSLYELQVYNSNGQGTGAPLYSIGLSDNTDNAYQTRANRILMQITPSASSNNVSIIASGPTGVARTVATFTTTTANLLNSHTLRLQLDYTNSLLSPVVKAFSNGILLGTTTLNGSEGPQLATTGTTQGTKVRALLETASVEGSGANLAVNYVNVSAYTTKSEPVPLAVVSRRTHGSHGNLDLPLNFAVGTTPPAVTAVECRSGNRVNVLITFDKVITSLNVALSAGTATVGLPIYDTVNRTVTIPLTNVSNAQRLQLNLSAIDAIDGSRLSNCIVTLSYLIADVNANAIVNTSDVDLVKSASGATSINSQNFTKDINADGFINASDVNLVKAASGNALP